MDRLAFLDDPAITASLGLRVLALSAELKHHREQADAQAALALTASSAEGRATCVQVAEEHVRKAVDVLGDLETAMTESAAWGAENLAEMQAAEEQARVDIRRIREALGPLLAEATRTIAAARAINMEGRCAA